MPLSVPLRQSRSGAAFLCRVQRWLAVFATTAAIHMTVVLVATAVLTGVTRLAVVAALLCAPPAGGLPCQGRRAQRRQDSGVTQSARLLHVDARHLRRPDRRTGLSGAHPLRQPNGRVHDGVSPGGTRRQEALTLLHPEDLPTVQRLFLRMSAERDGRVEVECRGRHADGSWRMPLS
ncbi:MAG: hypothetical protein U0531_02880 [Dehalococcoidia bacterium]